MGLRGRSSALGMKIFLGQGTELEAQRGSVRQGRAASLEIRKRPGRDQGGIRREKRREDIGGKEQRAGGMQDRGGGWRNSSRG